MVPHSGRVLYVYELSYSRDLGEIARCCSIERFVLVNAHAICAAIFKFAINRSE